MEEPGRRIVRQELACSGSALPWVDAVAFLRRVLDVATADLENAGHQPGLVFFDRGMIDAATGLQHLTGEPVPTPLRDTARYHRRVFLTPPWPEIYVNDPERRHGFDDAVAEYERLTTAYPSLGYEVVVRPKVGVHERADLVLAALAGP